MFNKSLLAGLAGIVMAAAAAVPAYASQWVELGEQTVGRNVDKDVYYVGADEGRYEALRFRVLGNRVAFAEARVFYGNGTSEVLNVKEHVQPGETTQASTCMASTGSSTASNSSTSRRSPGPAGRPCRFWASRTRRARSRAGGRHSARAR